MSRTVNLCPISSSVNYSFAEKSTALVVINYNLLSDCCIKYSEDIFDVTLFV